MISLYERPRLSNHSLLPIWDVIPITAVNKKKRLIRPKEQAYIKKLFLAQGITEEPQYDEYMEYYDLDRD